MVAPRWAGVPSGIDAARTLKVSWLRIYAGKDASTPTPDLKQIREILIHYTPAVALIVHLEVRHGFALDPDLPHHAADEFRDAFDRVTRCLKTYLR